MLWGAGVPADDSDATRPTWSRAPRRASVEGRKNPRDQVGRPSQARGIGLGLAEGGGGLGEEREGAWFAFLII